VEKSLVFNLGEELKLGGDPTPGAVGAGVVSASQFNTLAAFLSHILPNIYMIAGLILFFLLIGGGLMVIVNSGKGDEEGTKKGQQAITAALIGLVIVFAAWAIIKLLETFFNIQVFDNLTIPVIGS